MKHLTTVPTRNLPSTGRHEGSPTGWGAPWCLHQKSCNKTRTWSWHWPAHGSKGGPCTWVRRACQPITPSHESCSNLPGLHIHCFQDVVLAAVSCDGLALGYLNARKNRETSLRHNGENMRKPLGKGGVYGCIPHPLHTRLHYLLLVGGWICGARDPNARRWHVFVY